MNPHTKGKKEDLTHSFQQTFRLMFVVTRAHYGSSQLTKSQENMDPYFM